MSKNTLYTTFPEYLLDHNIWKFKLFVMQTLLEIAELQNYWGSRGSWYDKRISGAQWWILSNKIVLAWGHLDWPGGTSFDVVFKSETLAYLSVKILMEYVF